MDAVDFKKLDIARDASLECAEVLHKASPLLIDLIKSFVEAWKQDDSPELELDETVDHGKIYREMQSIFDDVHEKWKAALTSDVSDAILLAMPSGSSPVRAMDRNFASTHGAAGGALEVLGKKIGILLDRERMLGFEDKFRRGFILETMPDMVPSELRQGIDREWRDARDFIQAKTAELDASLATIPVEHRTKVMAKKNAAKLLGRPNSDSGVKWLNACIEDGTIRCEKINRQTFVFDKRDFPKEAHAKLN